MDNIYLQRRYPIAYSNGVKAMLAGNDIDQNPYTRPCTPTIRTEYNAWEAGFIEVHPYERRKDAKV